MTDAPRYYSQCKTEEEKQALDLFWRQRREQERKEELRPFIEQITNEDGSLNIENLAEALKDLYEELNEFRAWRRS